jgi:hypothetical protein
MAPACRIKWCKLSDPTWFHLAPSNGSGLSNTGDQSVKMLLLHPNSSRTSRLRIRSCRGDKSSSSLPVGVQDGERFARPVPIVDDSASPSLALARESPPELAQAATLTDHYSFWSEDQFEADRSRAERPIEPDESILGRGTRPPGLPRCRTESRKKAAWHRRVSPAARDASNHRSATGEDGRPGGNGPFCIMHPDVRLDEISPPW